MALKFRGCRIRMVGGGCSEQDQREFGWNTELERALARLEKKIKEGTSGSSQEEKKRIETALQELKKGNAYRNELIALSSNVQEEPGMKKFIEDLRAQLQQPGKGCQ